MKCTAAATCEAVKRDMPAGLDHTVLASSADAAPPANALPRPLPDCCCNANAEPCAVPHASVAAIPASAGAMRDFRDGMLMKFSSVVVGRYPPVMRCRACFAALGVPSIL